MNAEGGDCDANGDEQESHKRVFDRQIVAPPFAYSPPIVKYSAQESKFSASKEVGSGLCLAIGRRPQQKTLDEIRAISFHVTLDHAASDGPLPAFFEDDDMGWGYLEKIASGERGVAKIPVRKLPPFQIGALITYRMLFAIPNQPGRFEVRAQFKLAGEGYKGSIQRWDLVKDVERGLERH